MNKNYTALEFGMQTERRTSTDPPESHYIFRKIILLHLIY